MSGRSYGLAVPYGRPTLVKDVLEPGGPSVLFREQFDRNSWANLPSRIRVCRGHQKHNPLGWAKLDNTADGLIADIEWANTGAGRDAHEEARSKLMTGLSVSFGGAPSADIVTMSNGLPLVTRRRAELAEVSLVSEPAYSSARITAPDWSGRSQFSAEDLALLAPGIARLEARKAEARRAELVERAAREKPLRDAEARRAQLDRDIALLESLDQSIQRSKARQAALSAPR